MESARFAAMAAVGLGGIAMMINFLALPMLLTKVSKLQIDMQVGMQSFKAMTDQAWHEMMHIRRIYGPSRAVRDVEYDIGSGSGSGGASPYAIGYSPQSSIPSAADYQQQAWDTLGYSSASVGSESITPSFPEKEAATTASYATAGDNGCPAGPPGSPGDPGKDGLAGPPGLDGLQGQNAQEMKFEELDMCSICPGGPRGPAGPPGLPGLPGKKGLLGEIGKHGFNGTTGAPGPAGKRGFQGLPGKPGTKGKPGKPAPGGKGKPGPKGATGPIGRAGPQGVPGNASMLNNGTGSTGAPGMAGLNGIPGKTGQRGPIGHVGIPGGEGGYCPCPKELKILGFASDNGTAAPAPTGTTAGIPMDGGAASAASISAASDPPLATPPGDGTGFPKVGAPQPPSGNEQVQSSVLNFGASPPGYGPPGSSIASSGGGVVALAPAGGTGAAPGANVEGAQPPASHDQQQSAPQAATGELLAAQAGVGAGGGLNNVMQLPRYYN